VAHPAITAFAEQIEREIVLAQVLIQRKGKRFLLRHVEDCSSRRPEAHSNRHEKKSEPPDVGCYEVSAITSLRPVALDQLRKLAQFTADGAFRPLKSAPNLQRGWRCEIASIDDLDFALNQLYPGAVADWFAAQSETAPVTHYREFTARQSGMYRITTFLTDAQATPMIRACCHQDFCLKRRLWTVSALPPDGTVGKSLIPCLEPCAILLEFARRVTRLYQEEESNPPLSTEAVTELCTTAETALKVPDPAIAESDFNSPNNPRRARFVLEKHRPAVTPSAK
jgi:hypothetical protein